MKYFVLLALFGMISAVEVERHQAVEKASQKAVSHKKIKMVQESESESESESDDDKSDEENKSEDDDSDSDSGADESEKIAVEAQGMTYLKYDVNHPTATEWNKDKPHPGFQANHDDFEGTEGLGKYDRDPRIPEHFSGPGSGDDQFMNSMITKYALETATPKGKPTGDFVFEKVNA